MTGKPINLKRRTQSEMEAYWDGVLNGALMYCDKRGQDHVRANIAMARAVSLATRGEGEVMLHCRGANGEVLCGSRCSGRVVADFLGFVDAECKIEKRCPACERELSRLLGEILTATRRLL